MSTEYRRGIPSTAHVEAATRLGLLWEDDDVGAMRARWRLEIHEDASIRCDYATSNTNYSNWDTSPIIRAPDTSLAYRPIRPDGTPVDWEVLDQEVARVGQQGLPQTMATASAQSHGFRADLWQRIRVHLADGSGCGLPDVSSLDSMGFRVQSPFFDAEVLWPQGTNRADILARWTVYQELKPLYDIVDGAQGEAAMPADVADGLQAPYFRDTSFVVNGRDNSGRVCLHVRDENNHTYSPSTLGFNGVMLNDRLANFSAVLDAVAERRVAERVRGQTQAPVTSGLPPVPIGTVMVQDVDGTVRPARMNDTARVIGLAGIDMPAAVRSAAQPEPRRFTDVRPDRHGWRWWRQTGRDSTDLGQRFETLDGRCRWRSAHADAWFVPDTANPQMLRYTVIPTDEQGNPVSWEAAGFTAEAMRSAQETVQRAASDVTPARSVGDIEWTVTGLPVTQHMTVDPTTGMVRSTQPPPLPRFTADELDDVDHSKTTKLDEVTLRRGKLPTVEQIAKYREVRARRTGGTVADALKESRIDCEVAQYVLERWAGGLGDADTVLLLRAAGCIVSQLGWRSSSVRAFDPKQGEVDRRSQDFLRTHNPTLDTSEKPSPTAQRERLEAEERRQRLAELRQQLAAARAAQPQEMAKESEMSRFDLIEPDPQADPTASIRAWEARQAAAKVRPAAVPARPAAAPRRPAIEVVDAEVDGLSRSEAFAALFGRALNGGC